MDTQQQGAYEDALVASPPPAAPPPDPTRLRQRRTLRLFAFTALAAVVVGGLMSAAVAHEPNRIWVWLSAYLVLVVGVAQGVLGAGESMLADRAPVRITLWGQWLALNLGHVGVMYGTVVNDLRAVVIGTLLYALALGWFALAVRSPRRRRRVLVYRAFLLLMLVSALVGLGLAAYKA